jgi:hypothetical protein
MRRLFFKANGRPFHLMRLPIPMQIARIEQLTALRVKTNHAKTEDPFKRGMRPQFDSSHP